MNNNPVIKASFKVIINNIRQLINQIIYSNKIVFKKLHIKVKEICKISVLNKTN